MGKKRHTAEEIVSKLLGRRLIAGRFASSFSKTLWLDAGVRVEGA
jgi:hypothetical protein